MGDFTTDISGGFIKKIRFIMIALLLMIAFIFTCDLFQIYMYSFQDFYNTSFYIQPEIETEDMLKDICKTADAYQIQVFFIEKEISGDFYKNVNIYCDPEIKAYLEQELL